MNKVAFALPFAVFAALPARADDNSAMGAAATAFYTTYTALPHAGGIPDPAARARYTPLFSPGLNKLIADAVAAEARFHASNKSSPPLIEGDLFSSLFEGATSFKLGNCSGNGRTGQCNATLTHAEPGQKPVTWNDALVLANTPAGWKIDDIAYKAGFAFGNTGLLSETLRIVITEAP